MSKEFTASERHQYEVYELIRECGAYNMFDPRAREMSNLTLDEWTFVQTNFTELNEQFKNKRKLVKVSATCPFCGRVSVVFMSEDEFEFGNKDDGKSINEKFPSLNSQERELLMTGICETCWDNVTKTEDDE